MIGRGIALERGDIGSAVEDLQRALARAGHSPGEIDGRFGPLTQRAVESVQRRYGLPVTGAYGLREARIMAAGPLVRGDDKEAARAFLRRHGADGGVMGTPMTRHLATMLVDARAGDADRFAADHACTTAEQQVNAWVAWVALRCESLRVVEEMQNRGPLVDPIVAVGGGSPTVAPPWCAYFVVFCRRVALWLWRECEKPGAVFGFPVSGGASHTWLKAGDRALSRDSVPPIGSAYHRTRTKRPASDLRVVTQSGSPMPGHTGIVVGAVDGEPGAWLCVAGNSSGAGHSRRSGSGRVAFEVIGPVDDNPHAAAAWERLIGYTLITVDP